jgi:Rrf2 family protein
MEEFMRMSTRGRYALRAMVDLAINCHAGPVLLKDIAERQEISLKYLDHVIGPLRKNGLILREKNGYVLSRPPEEIPSLEILERVEGSLAPVPCVEDSSSCARIDICAAFELWKKLADSIENILESRTLKDLAEEHRRKNNPPRR